MFSFLYSIDPFTKCYVIPIYKPMLYSIIHDEIVLFWCEILSFSSLCSGCMTRVFTTEWSVDIHLAHTLFDWSDQYWESWSGSNLLGCKQRAQRGIQTLLAVKYIHPQYSWPTYSIALLIWERHCYAFLIVLLDMIEGHII